MNLCFESIGIIESDFKDPKDLIFACEKGLKTKTRSKIILDKKFSKGLLGIEEFSHAFIMYFLDEATRVELETHPGPPDIKLSKVGVFASRSQYRPNHIALRLVKIIKVKENELFVEGLDAINGSKVIDIKPYVKGFDRPKHYKIAPWYQWFEE